MDMGNFFLTIEIITKAELRTGKSRILFINESNLLNTHLTVLKQHFYFGSEHFESCYIEGVNLKTKEPPV